MNLCYAQEPITGPSIFLAGPTPRTPSLEGFSPEDVAAIKRMAHPSWRPDAIQHLRELGFQHTVLIPEDRSGVFNGDYDGQIDWETDALQSATCILFWVPRRMHGMPGLTSNDEWGFWKASGKVVWGAPDWAQKVSYQWHYCRRHGIPCSHDLREACELAIQLFEQRYEPELTVEWP